MIIGRYLGNLLDGTDTKIFTLDPVKCSNQYMGIRGIVVVFTKSMQISPEDEKIYIVMRSGNGRWKNVKWTNRY